MFLQAGFNGRHYNTGIKGWTRHVSGNRFAPADLVEFVHGGDLAWWGKRFLAWGEHVVLGSYGIELPWEWQHALPRCDIETKREFKGAPIWDG